MVTLLWIIYILDCLLLIGIILLQPGEGGDLAAAFGGASSQTAFGARGSATFMQKLTTGLAVTFMILSIILVVVTNRKQESNIMKDLPAGTESKPATAPAVPKPGSAPAQAPASVPAQTTPAATPGQAPAQQVPAQKPEAPAPKSPAPSKPAK
jgi:preprotein translocase subunit SecG